jgi:integrase
MLETTKLKYRKNAIGFANKHLKGKQYSDRLLIDTLNQVARNYRPKSFTNLKAALCLFFEEKGKKTLAAEVAALANPSVSNGTIKRKKTRQKSLNEKQLMDIYNAILTKEDAPLRMAFVLAYHCGVRPGEMHTIKKTSRNTFYITGIKKDEHGKRGADRHIKINSSSICNQISTAIVEIKKDSISKIQDRFKYLTVKLFPATKKSITLYTLRHQFCSELKSSNMGLYEIAYLMGHQSTRTMENYGYARSGTGNVKIRAAISLDDIKKTVRDKRTIRQVKRKARLPANDDESSAPTSARNLD